MKAELHIPTEQFGFVKVEIDVLGIEDAVAEYNRASKIVKGGTGLDEKEFNAFVDAQLMGVPNHVEMYEKATTEQKATIQILKRALSRIKSRQAKQ